MAQIAAGTLFAASFAAPALADRDFDDRIRDGYRRDAYRHEHDGGCRHGDSARYGGGYGGNWSSSAWVPRVLAPYARYGYRSAPSYYQPADYRCNCGKHFRSREQFARHLYRHHPRAYYAMFGGH
jgi:hypothetical protein